MMNIRKIETDVLVIGSGAAGLTASIYSAQSGQKVLIIDKGTVGRSGATVGAVQMAGAGRFASDDDSEEDYFQDTMESGRGLSNQKLVRILVSDIEDRLQDLVSWGLKLDMVSHEQVKLYPTPGHRYLRGISARKGNTGFSILQTLVKQEKKMENITHWSDTITIELLNSGEEITGALVYDLVKNEFVLIYSKAVVLATGGIGQLYPSTSNPVQATGDGFSLALKAGITLVEMEQVQFYPVSLAFPETVKGFCLSFYHLAKLYNSLGERFMGKYEPEKMENVTRDRLSQAISLEVQSGRGTPNHGVWLDARDCIDMVKIDYPHEYDMCLKMGFDLEKDLVEVAPAAHFMLGGVLINEDCLTEIPGLFVAGETSGGLHGGNRLVNNAITECVVFGARAGISAANYAKRTTQIYPTMSKSMESSLKNFEEVLTSHTGHYRPYQIKDKIRDIMFQYVGVSRTGKGLKKAQEELNLVEELLTRVSVYGNDKPLSRDILDLLEVSQMIWTSKAIIGSALIRNESRGAHYRDDFPESEPNGEHTTVKFQDGVLRFQKETDLRRISYVEGKH